MKSIWIKLGAVLAILITCVFVWLCVFDEGGLDPVPENNRPNGKPPAQQDGGVIDKGPAVPAKPPKGPRIRPPKARKNEKLAFGQWRDEFGDNDGEIRELCQKIVNELQEALDANDRTKVLLIIAKFRAPVSQGGLDSYVSKELRGKAVEALGWFGSASVTDLLEFMADQDSEVSEDAFAKFEQALDDWDMGDRERSQILQEVSKVMTDADRIDSLLFNLNNMRNSVKAETVAGILANGTPEAQNLMKEQVEFYLDMDVEASAEGVKKWKDANPDESTDEEFYGPQKSE